MHSYIWLWLTLASGVLLGFYDIFKKKSLEKIPVLNVLALYSVFSFLLVSYELNNAISINKVSLLITLIKALVIFLSWTLGFTAIKHLPISVISPFGTLSPVFTIFLGVFILNESLEFKQAIGIFVMLLSYYFIGMTGKAEIKGLFRNKYLYLMIGSSLLSAVSAMLDKIILKKVNSGQMQFWFCFFVMVMYVGAYLFDRLKSKTKIPLKFSVFIPLTSLFLVLSDKIYFLAVEASDSKISLILPLRKSSIIISAIVGGLLFREKNILKKFVCIAVLLIGIVIVFV